MDYTSLVACANFAAAVPAGLIRTRPIRVLSLNPLPEIAAIDILESDAVAVKSLTETLFSNNVFHFRDADVFERWTCLHPNYAKLLRTIGVDVVNGRMSTLSKGLKRCTGLLELSIGVDERSIVRELSQPKDGYQRVAMPPGDIDKQLNLIVGRQFGMDTLRQIRIPKTTFIKIIHGSISNVEWAKRTTGPIPGGFLETVVAKEMMQLNIDPPKTKHKRKYENAKVQVADTKDGGPTWKRIRREVTTPPTSPLVATSSDGNVTSATDDTAPGAVSQSIQHFRLLDCPGEIRNLIYKFTLDVDGKINPAVRTIPTSHHRAGPNLHEKDRYRPGPAPRSVLALLQTNKQVFKEATFYYYGQNNTFVFYYLNQLHMFLYSISDERKSSIANIVLWYQNKLQAGIDDIDVALLALKSLKGLKNLEVIMDNCSLPRGTNFRACIPGVRLMQDLVRQGVNVRLRHMEVDTYVFENGGCGSSGLDRVMNDTKTKVEKMEKFVRAEVDPDAEAETELL